MSSTEKIKWVLRLRQVATGSVDALLRQAQLSREDNMPTRPCVCRWKKAMAGESTEQLEQAIKGFSSDGRSALPESAQSKRGDHKRLLSKEYLDMPAEAAKARKEMERKAKRKDAARQRKPV